MEPLIVKSIPRYCLNDDYVELSNDHLAKYRYNNLYEIEIELKEDYEFLAEKEIIYSDEFDRPWLITTKRKIILFQNYCWNGCSPKRCFFGKWVGTPDFQGTILASGIHDALVQFYNTEHFPYTKEIVDRIFLDIMILSRFNMACIYHKAVDKFGSYERKKAKEKSLILA